MTPRELDALQALCDGATAGEWRIDKSEGRGMPHYDIRHESVGWPICSMWGKAFRGDTVDTDAAFIAAARTALPQLIAEVRRLQHYEEWARRVAKLPCCNDCADHKTCDKKPKWGEVCAINCPLWRSPQPAKEDK